jgi:hypothetical protein
VILRELGQAGQAQLCAARVAVDAGDSAGPVAQIASDYLRRAGLHVLDSAQDAQTRPLVLPSAAEVAATAGDPALQACAQWLLGAWAAVETVKECAGLGSAARSIPASLIAEVD